jgi:hypothetical protein
MSTIFMDSVKTVAFQNGVLRIDCIAIGPNSEERSSGTLLIPGNQAGPILQALVSATQELDKRIREHTAQQAPTVGTA